MRFGKIRVEDGELIFIRHMMVNSLPVKDILWAYVEKKSPGEEDEKLLLCHELVILTRRHKEYRFEMPEKEAEGCIRLLKALNSGMASGLPAGGRIPLLSLFREWRPLWASYRWGISHCQWKTNRRQRFDTRHRLGMC